MTITETLATPSLMVGRELILVPVEGDGAPRIRSAQPRMFFDDEIDDLVSSIATLGVLTPILVERGDDDQLWLVAGERRLRAAQRVLREHPEVHTVDAGIPAQLVPAELPRLDRYVVQIVENLGREDLGPTDLARGLMMTRCALLEQRLADAGLVVEDDWVADIGDPNARFRDLDQLRVDRGYHHVGAPLADVVEVLGIQISESRAQDLVRAWAAIPPSVSEEMDLAGVSVATRLSWVKLAGRNAQLAEALWRRVAEREQPDLLRAAVDVATADPEVDAELAVDVADGIRNGATVSFPSERPDPVPVLGDDRQDREPPAEPVQLPTVQPPTKPVAKKATSLLRPDGTVKVGGLLVQADAVLAALDAGGSINDSDLTALVERVRALADHAGVALA